MKVWISIVPDCSPPLVELEMYWEKMEKTFSHLQHPFF